MSPVQTPVPASEVGLTELMDTLKARWRLLFLAPLAAGVLALGATYLVKPTFTAQTTILPPQSTSPASQALASLGALANVAGGGAAMRTPADQYAALLQSTTVAQAMVGRFKLKEVYETDLASDTRRALADRTRVILNKKSGLITIEVDDHSPERAAEMANALVDELRKLTSSLALTEAQQRRVFFEGQMQQAKTRMSEALTELQASGVGDAALRAEPRSALESYSRLKAEVRSAEVRLAALRMNLSEEASEVQQSSRMLAALRTQLSKLEASDSKDSSAPEYLGRLREYKYQETLFELLARQYESAKVDEAREGALIQVVDKAEVPDRKSAPKRGLTAVSTVIVLGLLLMAWVLVTDRSRRERLLS